jgi:hypothetical protein
VQEGFKGWPRGHHLFQERSVENVFALFVLVQARHDSTLRRQQARL